MQPSWSHFWSSACEIRNFAVDVVINARVVLRASKGENVFYAQLSQQALLSFLTKLASIILAKNTTADII